MVEKTFDFIVVGAGMAGASVAWRLARSGASVCVIEREAQPGHHSTGRSAALFMESYGTPQIRALTRASRVFFEQPPTGFAEHPLLQPRGTLHVARTGQDALLAQALAAYQAEGLRARLLSAEQAIALVPCLKPEGLIGAVHDEGAMDIDVAGLHQGFLRGMTQSGARLLCQAELVAARHGAAHGSDSANIWHLQLQDGRTLHGHTLVNAAGAWADPVARLCGARPLGIQPKRRSAFTFAPPEGANTQAWPAVIAVDESFYFKPDAGQLLGSPANADPVPPHDVVAEELDVATGIHHIQDWTTLHIRRPSHVWAGLRSFAPDGEFVIGPDPSCAGFFWLAGQGGYGIQTAAGASATAHALLLGQPPPPELQAQGVNPLLLSPARQLPPHTCPPCTTMAPAHRGGTPCLSRQQGPHHSSLL